MTVPDAILLKVGELFLKAGSRARFLKKLKEQVRLRLAPFPEALMLSPYGHLLVRLPPGFPEEKYRALLEELTGVFGLSKLVPVRLANPDLDSLAAMAVEEARRAVEQAGRPDLRFRLTVKRADKSFPHRSLAVIERLAKDVVEACPGFTVNLEDFDWNLTVEIQAEGVYVSTRALPGAGGLPIASSGHVTLLLSGGIDSPVAGVLAMKRGCAVRGIYFDSFPLIGREARAKVEKLSRRLSEIQGSFELTVVPFAEIQKFFKRSTDPRNLVLLYRRSMYRLAERHMLERGDGALVTGDNVGQVASQTIPNLTCLDRSVQALVLRPLTTFDKLETIGLSRRWGLYEASTEAAEDPCSLFMPLHPELAGRPEHLGHIEELLKQELPALEEKAMAARETVTFRAGT
jgi:thiamine biosynthesis protein ThiI